MAKDLNEFGMFWRTEILRPERIIHASTHSSIEDLGSVPAQRDTFVAAAWSAINNPADACVALHGAPLGARRPGADVVREVNHHEPHGDHTRKTLAIEISQP